MRRAVPETADQWADNRRQAEDAAEQSLIASAVGRWDNVGDRRHADHHQPPPPSLCSAHQYQLRHVLRQPAERGTGKKQHDRHLQHDFTPEQIAEFTVQRHHDGRAEDIGGNHPREFIQSAELANDSRQGGGDNGLVQRRQQHHQQQGAEQQAD